MYANWRTDKRSLIVGLLGAALLMGEPATSLADQGKWWNPDQGGKSNSQGRKNREARQATPTRTNRATGRGQAVVHRDARAVTRSTVLAPRTYRRVGKGYVVAPQYAAPVARGYAYGQRYSRPYGGYRVYRDVVTVGAGYYGGGYYAGSYYGPGSWYAGGPIYRYYAYPTYYYPTQACYVQPVRFYFSAGVTVGGVGIYGGYANPAYFYGCNFCPAQFGTYGAYSAHVGACSAAPHGYNVVASDWDDDWQGHQEERQGHWERDYDHD